MTSELTARESFDLEWAHASALGEAVWLRACAIDGVDPKAPEVRARHDAVVALVRGAAFVLEREGFDGLAQWLNSEAMLDDVGE